MSDFASLLGQLQKTAKRASAADNSTNDINSKSSSASAPCLSQMMRNEESKKRSLAADNDDDSHRQKHGFRGDRVELSDKHRNSRKRHRGSSSGNVSSQRLPRDVRDSSVTVSFLCIGAQKAGTTWLHEMLRQHPRLSLPEQKEVHFWDWHRRKGLRWYSQQFPRIKSDRSLYSTGVGSSRMDEILHGEITPCYVVLPDRDIGEIKALFPDLRIVFIARDLVERAWSALLTELRNAVRGIDVGKFDIDDHVDQRRLDQYDKDADPERYEDSYFMDRLRHSIHTERSDYATGLRKWLEHFSADQILILDYRDISQNPRLTLERVYEHIGIIDHKTYLDSLDDKKMCQKFNVATGSTSNKPIRPSLRKQMEQYLQPFAQDFNALLVELGYGWKISVYF